MDASRTGFRSVVEWVLAAALLAGVVGLGSVALREIRTVAAVTPVIAREATAQVPTANVPDRAVSVPVLLLSEALEIRVGDAAAEVLKRLQGVRDLVAPTAERGPNGERQTRMLEFDGTRFVLVVEPFARDTEPRVAAIYLP